MRRQGLRLPSRNAGWGNAAQAARMASTPETYCDTGAVLQGWVKSFQSDWGFVRSDAFEGDLFFHSQFSGHVARWSQDDQVDFEIESDAKGRLHAVRVTAQNPTVTAKPEELIGQRVQGWLKQFKDGWGFMNSHDFLGDLFVHNRENPDVASYPPLTEFFFTVSQDSKGKPMATQAVPCVT